MESGSMSNVLKLHAFIFGSFPFPLSFKNYAIFSGSMNINEIYCLSSFFFFFFGGLKKIRKIYFVYTESEREMTRYKCEKSFVIKNLITMRPIIREDEETSRCGSGWNKKEEVSSLIDR